ncbi:MAG: hypothetical protein KDD84_19780, partial [Caldilineaceae bacterium]|nr:hypothetical protein [Caldilineaceae bacterium]
MPKPNRPVSKRKQILAVALGSFYTLLILSVAAFVGTVLYETARSYVTANTSLPDLTAFDAIQVDQASEVQLVAPAETD